jgi:hypothetical protein
VWDTLTAAPALLAAVFGWRLYRHYVALLWAVFAASLLILSVDHVAVFANSLLVALVSSRALFDRYKNIIMIMFVIAVIVKIFLFTEYYLDERFIYIYYIVDGVFTGCPCF